MDFLDYMQTQHYILFYFFNVILQPSKCISWKTEAEVTSNKEEMLIVLDLRATFILLNYFFSSWLNLCIK